VVVVVGVVEVVLVVVGIVVVGVVCAFVTVTVGDESMVLEMVLEERIVVDE
jgi:hypothetical protein